MYSMLKGIAKLQLIGLKKNIPLLSHCASKGMFSLLGNSGLLRCTQSVNKSRTNIVIVKLEIDTL